MDTRAHVLPDLTLWCATNSCLFVCVCICVWVGRWVNRCANSSAGRWAVQQEKNKTLRRALQSTKQMSWFTLPPPSLFENGNTDYSWKFWLQSANWTVCDGHIDRVTTANYLMETDESLQIWMQAEPMLLFLCSWLIRCRDFILTTVHLFNEMVSFCSDVMHKINNNSRKVCSFCSVIFFSYSTVKRRRTKSLQ